MEEIWHRCNMIRIYTKPQGQIPDYEDPVILHSTNPTIEEFCNRLHKGIMSEFNYGKLSQVTASLDIISISIVFLLTSFLAILIMTFSAWVWGSSAKHQPQRCGKEHLLNDEDIVQIVKKV